MLFATITARRLGRNLKRVNDAIVEVASIEEITASILTAQQETNEVYEQAQHMVNITEENAKMVEDMKRASDELSDMADSSGNEVSENVFAMDRNLVELWKDILNQLK